MSRIHSSSPAVMSHFFAISAKAPQNCSSDSLSCCFLFSSLCHSNVTFVFFTKAIARESKNFLKAIYKIFTLVNFCPKILFPSFPNAKYRTDRSFLSASSSRIPLNFLVSDLIEADSFLSYHLCSGVFLSILDRIWLSVSPSIGFSRFGGLGWCLSEGFSKFSMSIFSLAIIAKWNRSLQSFQGMGGSTVWFCQNEGIPLTLYSLFDCAMIMCYFVVANSKLKLLKRIKN